MTIRDDLNELERFAASAPESAGPDLSALESIEAVFGFLIAHARVEGGSEGDCAELFVRFSNMTAPEVRKVAGTLRRLGYRAAADRLFAIAGKRQHDLRPL